MYCTCVRISSTIALLISLLPLIAISSSHTVEPSFTYGSGLIRTLDCSSNGLYAASGGTAGVFLWDTKSGNRTHSLMGHTAEVATVNFSPDNQFLVSGGNDNTIKIWHVSDGAEIHSIPLPGRIISLAFSPDGKRIVANTSELFGYTTRTIETENYTIEREINHAGNSQSDIAFFKHGNWFLLASGYMYLFDLFSGEILTNWTGQGATTAVAVSTDDRVATLGGGRDVKGWDTRTGELVVDINGLSGEVNDLNYSSDGRFLLGCERKWAAYMDQPGGVWIWDLVNKKMHRRFIPDAKWVRGAKFSKDGKSVLASWDDTHLQLFDLESGEVSLNFPGHTRAINAIEITNDSKTILIAEGNLIHLLNAEDGLEEKAPLQYSSLIHSIYLNKKNDTLYVGGDDLSASRLRYPQGDQQTRYSSFLNRYYSVCVSSNDQYAAGISAAAYFNPTACLIWDAQTGEPLHSLGGGYYERFRALKFSPDNSMVITAGQLTIEEGFDEWGDPIATFYGGYRLWDTKSGELIKTVIVSKYRDGDDHPWVYDVDFTPDGTAVVTGSHDGAVRLWDTKSGEVLQSFHGHAADVLAVDVSPDGKYLITGSADNSVRLWDIRTGELLYFLGNFSNDVTSVQFSPNLEYLVAGSDDGTARVWLTDTLLNTCVEKWVKY